MTARTHGLLQALTFKSKSLLLPVRSSAYFLIFSEAYFQVGMHRGAALKPKVVSIKITRLARTLLIHLVASSRVALVSR